MRQPAAGQVLIQFSGKLDSGTTIGSDSYETITIDAPGVTPTQNFIVNYTGGALTNCTLEAWCPTADIVAVYVQNNTPTPITLSSDIYVNVQPIPLD